MDAPRTDLDRLLAVVDAYLVATGLSEARVSTLFLKRGSRLAELRAGGDMGARLAAEVVERFAANWPDGAAWPAGVTRPSPAAVAGHGPSSADDSQAEGARAVDETSRLAVSGEAA
jgi:hypothetical protein